MFTVVTVPSDLRLDEKPISRPATPPPGVDRADQVRDSRFVKPHVTLTLVEPTHRSIHR